MKRLSIMPIVALLVAFTFSAFTNQPKQSVGQYPKWYYTEADNDGVNIPENYEALDEQDAGCLSTPGVVCVIEAPDESGFPDLDNDVVISFKP